MEASSSTPPNSVSLILRLERFIVAIVAFCCRSVHFLMWATVARVEGTGSPDFQPQLQDPSISTQWFSKARVALV